MNKLYFVMLGIAGSVGVWYCGVFVGDAKCRANISQQNLQNIQNYQNQIIKNKRQTDETVYKTSLGDIRRILRDKYSIAE